MTEQTSRVKAWRRAEGVRRTKRPCVLLNMAVVEKVRYAWRRGLKLVHKLEQCNIFLIDKNRYAIMIKCLIRKVVFILCLPHIYFTGKR
ncbi:hypothetical protein Desgi_4623 [Desulfoscipio gibsoniae DSM 7213]|uniref:Uncharacterized protein n=1 Tax=Desulfoscipio gibsoniae DSM 7213 TaxID=767817 RepID=R4KTC5_9FIRM|nr:hypothetical protein Desgi_4623 [Desulfoscipio gibsoniae DSM 7213]